MSEAFIAIGSNLGKRLENANAAIKSLNFLCKTKVLKVSRMYITEPCGTDEKQNMFVNCCVKIETLLSPHALLGACLGIESALGRVRTVKNAARVIDLDLLLYDDIILNTEDLVLPHPRMLERKFVMEPLLEIKDF